MQPRQFAKKRFPDALIRRFGHSALFDEPMPIGDERGPSPTDPGEQVIRRISVRWIAANEITNG